MKEGLLVTASGQSFRGRSAGVDGVRTGEVVFCTSMCGYQEVVTDPSYAAQIIVMTAPHIGNYGVAADDSQADRIHASALITRSLSPRSRNWRADGPMGEYLVGNGLVALTEVDTRCLTLHVRERGAMAAAVGTDVSEAELLDLAEATPQMEGSNLASAVTCPAPYDVEPESEAWATVVLMDLGTKRDIIRQLTSLGLSVHVVPAHTPAADVAGAQGLVLSNGPGDPEPLTGPIELVRSLLGTMPVLGICLGHQILGLALGARIFKLPFGHHGANHPVRRLADGRVEITSQNHGFAVDLWSLAGSAPPRPGGIPGPELLPPSVPTPYGVVEPTHQNLNDGTLEGLRFRDLPAVGIQYHPEAAPGPHDASYHFRDFARLLER